MERDYNVIIIGAGIAGLSAAIYLRRAGRTVLILEKQARGGQALETENVENFPGFLDISGSDLTEKIYHQVNNLGANFAYASVEKIIKTDNEEGNHRFLLKTDEGDYSCHDIIIATGVQKRKLNLSREDEFLNKGLSYCVNCDGALFKNQPVAVLGGGNSALYSALYLSDLAEKVYLIHRRSEFRGEKILINRLKKKPNVEFVLDSTPVELIGDTTVSGLKVKNVQTDAETTLSVSGIFVAFGMIPVTDLVKNLVELDASGYIIAGEDCRTSAPGIFVAGDCRQKPLRQLITAAADGAAAASSLLSS